MIVNDEWELRFTQSQLSMIATLLANYEPLCCDEGRKNIALIVPGRSRKARKLRDDLASHAYENWACRSSSKSADRAAENVRFDRFFAEWLESVGFEPPPPAGVRFSSAVLPITPASRAIAKAQAWIIVGAGLGALLGAMVASATEDVK